MTELLANSLLDITVTFALSLAERQSQSGGGSASEIWTPTHNKQFSCSSIIDGNFLSMAFGGALLVIVSVSVYAFYHLYQAVLKKFPSRHTEL